MRADRATTVHHESEPGFPTIRQRLSTFHREIPYRRIPDPSSGIYRHAQVLIYEATMIIASRPRVLSYSAHSMTVSDNPS
jgi:hypothetical protein